LFNFETKGFLKNKGQNFGEHEKNEFPGNQGIFEKAMHVITN
jgi:hypothetical protein